MSMQDTEIYGFLYVKSTRKRYNARIAQRVRKRALALSKIWKRLWCSIRKLGPGLGLQVQFDQKLSYHDNALKQNEKDSSVVIPPNAIVHRILSRTKQFAFSISSAVDRKPLLSLSANSETETQRWMANIRHLLKPRRHCCIEKSYDVSIVDNAHSKAAGLIGLYGDLIANQTGIFIRNVYTGEIAKTFKWTEFTQFHLMTAGRPEDVKRICVIHTSKEFCCGIGELYIFCLDANKLLQDLVTQGRGPKHRQKFLYSDGDNLETRKHNEISSLSSPLKSDAPLCMLNTDTNCLRTPISTKVVKNMYHSEPNLMYSEKLHSCNHRKSNTSIASGIYEEIMDNICSPKMSFTSNEYKDTDKISCNLQIEPPALPPRQKHRPEYTEEDRMDTEQYSHQEISNHFKSRLQNTICTQKSTLTDSSSYVPMSPQLRNNMLKSDVLENLKENDYVIMR
ncbi:PREDICTED: uncharacterized protein LOC108748701 [Trachymyrmex septentrionalis]|uniref:uncharacterized protein LOC108748701 n=1 Tax=Trachymyrmex septentrionalis TaxID=34720 RepID=UPI00084EF82B|nr:PREDICTED: uncharacterized protein LOC108748701 [Trachymyrmex septentrionalis]